MLLHQPNCSPSISIIFYRTHNVASSNTIDSSQSSFHLRIWLLSGWRVMWVLLCYGGEQLDITDNVAPTTSILLPSYQQ